MAKNDNSPETAPKVSEEKKVNLKTETFILDMFSPAGAFLSGKTYNVPEEFAAGWENAGVCRPATAEETKAFSEVQ